MVIQLNCNIQICICRTQSLGKNSICEALLLKQPFSLSNYAGLTSQWKDSLSAVSLNNNAVSTAFPIRHTIELKLCYILVLLYYSKASLTGTVNKLSY